MERVISVDWETFYDKKAEYDIKSLGAWKYCDDSRFDPYLIAVSDGQESWAGQPKDFNWESLRGAILVSHNKAFDAMVYESMVRKGLAPRVEFAAWHCTANLSSYLCNRRSLKDAASFLLGVTLSKETRAYADGKHWADMVTDGKAEEMLAYGRSDALHCQQLWAKYGHLWPDSERRLSAATIEQGDRGIAIDVPLLEKYIVLATQTLQRTEEQLPWMKEGRVATSPKAIAERCRKEGIPGPPVKSHEGGEEAFVQWEALYGPKFSWVAGVADWRSLNKFLKTLHTIQTRLRPDGTLPFSLKYGGAHTLRWSGDSGLNFQNFRKVPLFIGENGLLAPDSGVALDIRRLLIPRPGMRMATSDLAQIEPRCLAWLVGDTAMLASMAAGYSPYEAAARARGEWTKPESLKSGDKALYALKKAQVLALGYGAGPDKFETMAMTLAGLDLSAQDPEFVPVLKENGEPLLDEAGQPVVVSGKGTTAKRIVKEWREANPGVTSLWKQLDTALKSSAGGAFTMTLPSGRDMRYGAVSRECRSVKNLETGKFERKWMTFADIGGRRFSLYGGLICENLVQSTARDVFAEAMLRVEKIPGVHVLFTVHDEIVCEIEEGVKLGDLDKAMSETPEWLPGCPIAAETNEVPHYTK